MIKSNYIKFLFLIIVFVLLAVSILTYRNLTNYTTEVNLIRHSDAIIELAEKVLSSIKDAEIGHRGYQLTRDTTYLAPYYASLSSLPEHLKQLDSLILNNEDQRKEVDTLESLVNGQFIIISKILSNAQRSSLYMDRYESTLLAEGRKNMTHIRSVVKHIVSKEQKIFNERVSKENNFKNVAPISLLIYGLIALGGVTILFNKVLEELYKRRKVEDELWLTVETLRKEVRIREFTQKTLRNILDNSLNGIMAFKSIRNKEGVITDFECILANTISSKFINSIGGINGRRLLQLIPENKSNGLFSAYVQVVEKGTPIQVEKLYQVNGLKIWHYITAVKLEDGCVVTMADITEEKLQRIVTEEQKILLNEAEALAKMGSWKWGVIGNEMVWSDGLYKIMGKETTYVPSWNSFLENVYAEDLGIVDEFVKEVKINHRDQAAHYRIVIEGSIHHVSITSKIQDPSISRDMMGTVIDITQQKVYEQQLQQYNIDLKRSNEDLEQFAYTASHDLQEPLRKIRAFGDRLSLNYKEKLEQTGADYINRMQSAATRMQVLIEDLLAYARVSRGAGEFEILNPGHLLHEVLDDLDSQIKREDARITVESIPAFKGNKIQIKRLFQNLISNAIKFHKPNESPVILLAGTLVKGKEVLKELNVTLPGLDFVRISIKDNGIGFDKSNSEKIFNIFQQLHGRMEFEGTGIGLAICRKIVAHHHGIIRAIGEEDKGSEFIIIVPQF